MVQTWGRNNQDLRALPWKKCIFAIYPHQKCPIFAVYLTAGADVSPHPLPTSVTVELPPVTMETPFVLAGKSGIQNQLDSAMQEVTAKYLLLEETEKSAVRNALIQERSRFCLFISCLKPVVVSRHVVFCWWGGCVGCGGGVGEVYNALLEERADFLRSPMPVVGSGHMVLLRAGVVVLWSTCTMGNFKCLEQCCLCAVPFAAWYRG